MATVVVPVLKPLTYQGRSYVRGERALMRAIDAAAYGRSGHVALSAKDVAPDPPPVEAPPVPTRRRTRTRDLQAEQSETDQPTTRQYRRRDMVAEP